MPLPESKSRYCRTCKKLFCCAKCRQRHEERKHPGRQVNCPLCTSEKLPLRNFKEDEAFLCHIIDNHLPLYCCLCGQLFKQSEDLENFESCKWYQYRQRHSLVQKNSSQPETSPSLSDVEGSAQNSIENGEFVSLTSPPVLYRNTSTPMVMGEKTAFEFKTPNVPNFSLKTPKTDSAVSLKNQTRGSIQSHSETKDSNSNFVSFSISNVTNTPFRSLSQNKFDDTDNREKIMVYEVNDSTTDNYCVEDMELTGLEERATNEPASFDALSDKLEKRSESLKKVRFSDQYDSARATPTSTFNSTENEEFFEARESTSEDKENIENNANSDINENTKICMELKNSIDKEQHNAEHPRTQVIQQSSGTSRIVMMVVVENNVKNTVSTSDLMPLIDSGLKQLGNTVASSSHSVMLPVSSTPNIQSPESSTSSASSIDSCCNISNCPNYSNTNAVQCTSSELQSRSIDDPGPSTSGGLFSAVAHAVRAVMRNFAGGSKTSAISREQISREVVITSSPAIQASVLSSTTSSILHRPGKRPRDSSDSISSAVRAADLVVAQLDPRSPLPKRRRGWHTVKGREPLSRMRARNVVSPRGISSETQVFSQGSLTVRDTILPLPARAHQSTQTE